MPSRERESRRSTPLDVTVVAAPRNWAALLILLLSAVVIAALAPFLAGLLGAVVLYVITDAPYERLARRVTPALAAAAMVIAALVLIVAPLGWVVMVLIDRAPHAVSAALASPFLARLDAVQIGHWRLSGRLSAMGDAVIAALPSAVARLAGSATLTGINLTIALFGLYYLLRASSGTWEYVRQYIPFSARSADALRLRFVSATQATVLGTGLSAAAQGVLVGLGFALTGLPEPVFWGAIAAGTALIPVVGSTLVWLPGVIFLGSGHRYASAVLLLIFGFGLAGNVDRIIRPVVYRHFSEMHPMVTLVGVLAGVRYAGLMGLLLGPLAIAYVFELLRFYRDEYGSA